MIDPTEEYISFLESEVKRLTNDKAVWTNTAMRYHRKLVEIAEALSPEPKDFYSRVRVSD